MDRHARFFFEVNDNFTRRFRQTYLVIGSHIVALKETFPQGFPRANETKYLVMKYQLVFFLLTFVFHRFFSVLSWTLCPKTYSARVTLNSYFQQEIINLVSTQSFLANFVNVLNRQLYGQVSLSYFSRLFYFWIYPI